MHLTLYWVRLLLFHVFSLISPPPPPPSCLSAFIHNCLFLCFFHHLLDCLFVSKSRLHINLHSLLNVKTFFFFNPYSYVVNLNQYLNKTNYITAVLFPHVFAKLFITQLLIYEYFFLHKQLFPPPPPSLSLSRINSSSFCLQ